MYDDMDYGLVRRTPDGSGMILVTSPGTPETGAFETEQDLKNWIIAAVGGAIIPKGDILSTNLPAASASNKGWQYYCTDINKWATSDGTQWIMTSNNVITQTPDATDTGHALSNAVVTQCCNEVKGKLDQHESRLENLEQKAGDYSIVQYRGTNAVPTGKAKYGLVKNIVGKSRAWNQLFNKSTLHAAGGSGSASISGGVVTIIGNATVDENPSFSTVSGHIYLFAYQSKNNVSGDCAVVNYHEGSGARAYTIPQSSGYVVNCFLFTSNGAKDTINFRVRNYVSGTLEIKDEIILRDLTLIFGAGNEPSTVEEALALLPALGQYNAYDAGSLVDTEVSGVKSVGVNIWDEEWELGTFNTTTGADVSSSSNIRAKNIIPLKPNTTYYLKSQASAWCILYDANGNVTSSSSVTPVADRDGNSFKIIDASFTTPTNVFGMRFYLVTGYGTTYNHDIQVCLNSYADKTTYHPYKTDTLSLSETVTLREDDELTPETGAIIRKMVRVDLSDYDWNYSNSYWNMVDGTKKTNFINMVKAFGPNAIPNWISANLEMATGVQVVQGSKTYVIGQSSDNSMLVNNGSGTTPPSGALVVELATPTTESIDPIPDNFIEVEGGGTIETIQDQTPVIDNCLDVGYLAV